MGAKGKRFTIVAGIDGSEMAQTVLEYTCDLASRHDDAEIHLLAVVDGKRRDAERLLDAEETRLRDLVEETLPAFGWKPGAEGWRVRIHARAGKPSEEICGLAGDARADAIVIGRHGETGRLRDRFGNVPDQVLRGALCPVWVVQPNDYVTEAPTDAITCEACAAVRRDSDGERWFCEAHSSHSDTLRSSYLRPGPVMSDRGQGLWF